MSAPGCDESARAVRPTTPVFDYEINVVFTVTANDHEQALATVRDICEQESRRGLLGVRARLVEGEQGG
jgi:hypothetical protein